jgi:hypothetical protein
MDVEGLWDCTETLLTNGSNYVYTFRITERRADGSKVVQGSGKPSSSSEWTNEVLGLMSSSGHLTWDEFIEGQLAGQFELDLSTTGAAFRGTGLLNSGQALGFVFTKTTTNGLRSDHNSVSAVHSDYSWQRSPCVAEEEI